MNRKEQLQYLADSLLIDKLAIINIGMHKNAGLMESVSGAFGEFIDSVKERVAKEGMIGALTDYFVMGLSPWWLKSIVLVADQFDINIGSVLKSIWNEIKPKAENNEQFSVNEVKTIVENHIGGTPDAAQSDDMLYSLRKFESEGKLVRMARTGDNPILGALSDLINGGRRTQGKSLIGGLIFRFVLNILVGAGLLTGGSIIAKQLGVGKDKKEQSSDTTKEQKPTSQNEYHVKPLPWVPPVVSHSLTNTGNGQTHFINDGISKTWSVPLKGDLKNTMILWAGYVYKELEGQKELLNSTPAFNIMVSNLNNYVNRSYLLVPPNFHSLKDIVDTFAGQAARKLDKPKES